jgi:hypothetical protein
MYRLLRELDPEGVEQRRKRAFQHRGQVVLQGPNDVWSMDAYCKLEHWGVQIYAVVDAYSRFVVWYYVGISGRTAISVLGQYISTVVSGGIIPRKIRTDRGAETPMTADAHYKLSSEVRQVDDRHPLDFGDTFRFGTSKQNSVIERWWRQQPFGAILQWRDCFLEYNRNEEFKADWRSDRVAFLAIYMPILRRALSQFVHLWNNHKIRKQPKRPYLQSGIPYLLYNYPERTGGTQSGFEVPQDSPTMQSIQDDIRDLDLDEYLLPATLDWGNNQLQHLGFNSEIDGSAVNDNGDRLHKLAFIALRDTARHHALSGVQPYLEESDKPWNVRRWSASYQPSEQIQKVFRDANEEMMIQHPIERYEDEIAPMLDDNQINEGVIDPRLLCELQNWAVGNVE